MKTLLLSTYTTLLILCTILCTAQVPPNKPDANLHPTLEEKVVHSDLVVEGQVIATKGFEPVRGKIYTSVIIKVTKIFKGTIVDSIIELILEGGRTDSALVIVTHTLHLSAGYEGIFLLGGNKTEIKLVKDVQSYMPKFGRASYVAYQSDGLHRAVCFDAIYDDLEMDLFKPIEVVTKTHCKVLGLNMFEQKAGKSLKGKN